MMTAYIYKDEWDTEFGVQFDLCAAGFKEHPRFKDYKVKRYHNIDEISPQPFEYLDVHYGPSDDTHRLVRPRNILPDYPERLNEYTLPRTQCALSEAPTEFPFFIKPVQHKLFKGFVARGPQDLNFIEDDPQVWIGEYVDIPSEWRVYVENRYQVVKICHYAGDPLILPDTGLIQELIQRLQGRAELLPRSYALDVSPTHLIEANDMLSIGNYGLDGTKFAEMIENRWMQLWQD